MLLMIKGRGPFGCLDLTQSSLNWEQPEQELPLPLHSYVVGYATLCADPQGR